ncbi:MAG: AI-2E family transporter [Pseudanabaena sp. ELA607]
MFTSKGSFSQFLKRLFLACVVVYLVFRLRQTVQLLLTSLFLAGAIAPLVEAAVKLRFKFGKSELGLNRAGAVTLIYIIFFGVMAISIMPAPRLLQELGIFLSKLPTLIGQINLPNGTFLGLNQTQLTNLLQTPLIEQIQVFGREIAGQTVELTLRTLNAIGIAILSLLITAYMVINSRELMPRVLRFFSKEIRQEIETLLPPITNCLGAYVVGRIGTSALLGFCTYLALIILNIPYASALGLLVGVANCVPYIGGLVSLTGILIAAWSPDSGNRAFLAVTISFILQQIEAFVLQPWLVAPYLNLDPIELLLSVIVGAELLGVVGAIIAPPIAGVMRILFTHISQRSVPKYVGKSEDVDSAQEQTNITQPTTKSNNSNSENTALAANTSVNQELTDQPKS